MKRTYQPSKIKKHKKHGYLKRMRTKCGKNIILRRIRKSRKKIAV